MRIIVFGAGALGGFIGARLLQAGHDIAFIARGAHLDVLRRDGLQVTGSEGEFSLPPLRARDDPAELEPADAVLLCVKMYDVERAAAQLAPLLQPGGSVLTVQNGIEAPDIVAATVGDDAVLAGAAFIGGAIEAPGRIRMFGGMTGAPLLAFGPRRPAGRARGAALSTVLNEAGVRSVLDPAVDIMLWRKFCLISATSASTALTRQTIGAVRSDPDTRWLIETAVAETAAVGRARGVPLARETEADVVALIDGMPAHAKASQLGDLEAGKPLELEWLSGAVRRLGAEAGMPTPLADTAYAALKPHASGRRI